MAKYNNTTKTSVFAGGKWVPQGGKVEIGSPNNAEAALITGGALSLTRTKPKAAQADSETPALGNTEVGE